MGSPISPIVANLYMEAFEVQAINSAPHHPSLWRRFVDDTFVVIQTAHKDRFIEHINSIDEKYSLPWMIARMMDPCLFGHSNHIPTRWEFQHYSVQKTNPH